MTRIRHLKPRVEPPKDRPVQWFFSGAPPCISNRPLGHVIAWCIPATLTETSGPVHSLEPEELPASNCEVQVRVDRHWFPGWVMPDGRWLALRPFGGHEVVLPDAWRPLPDDEPGDAELLEAARRWAESRGTLNRHPADCEALAKLVEKRSGKDGGK